ncbi:outer membrane protein assembly factor BamB family protein [Bythopirellula polymerisocia]|uniref:Outer membrane biogenesis protein BamB n=1 Tax=Bythopirellula polymerisocia TaxID=2528003 RepID=A0A5C6CPZ3_9BACT|nr:PQQ-binding-like beta-propeller repeat protein [Bythopirellula polymerisocia]TWU25677.1 outer membrane biogenesis protein BamB [Bythopirellula polymerisocia]
MFKYTCSVVTFLAVLFTTLNPSLAEESALHWPGFRGPEFTGVAPKGNPPTTWSEEENVRWKVAIPGQGSGSPTVWGDRIYLQTAIKTDRTADTTGETAVINIDSQFQLVGNERYSLLAQAETPQETERPRGEVPRGGERRRRGGFGGRGGGFGRAEVPTNYYQFVVMCLDRNTGEVVWQQTACEAVPHEGHHGTASFASPTPVTDGKNLYVSFGSRGIYSYTMDGKLRWHKDLGKMSIRNVFGEGSSPALYKDTLIVNWDHEGQSFITALDANTGESKWKVERDEETTWLTPLIVEHDGKVQVIVNGMNRARGYDLANGEIIWECGGQAMGAVPTAVAYGDLVFCMTGHRGAALYAIPLGSKGDITDSDQIAWHLDRDTPYVPSPLIYGDHLYFTKSNNAILSCYNAETGEVIYRGKRLPEMDSIYASPVAAANRIYFAGRNGATTVVKHGPEFEVLATNMLDEPIDATPAIVGNEMIIRTSGHLYSIAE